MCDLHFQPPHLCVWTVGSAWRDPSVGAENNFIPENQLSANTFRLVTVTWGCPCPCPCTVVWHTMWELTAGTWPKMQCLDAGAWEAGVLPSTGRHPQRGVPPLALVDGAAYFEMKDEVFLPKSCFESELSIKELLLSLAHECSQTIGVTLVRFSWRSCYSWDGSSCLRWGQLLSPSQCPSWSEESWAFPVSSGLEGCPAARLPFRLAPYFQGKGWAGNCFFNAAGKKLIKTKDMFGLIKE